MKPGRTRDWPMKNHKPFMQHLKQRLLHLKKPAYLTSYGGASYTHGSTTAAPPNLPGIGAFTPSSPILTILYPDPTPLWSDICIHWKTKLMKRNNIVDIIAAL